MSACDKEMLTLNEFLFLYRLKASTTVGILNFYVGIRNLGLLEVFLHLFVIGNHDTFLSLERVGKACLTISRGKSQDYYENGKS